MELKKNMVTRIYMFFFQPKIFAVKLLYANYVIASKYAAFSTKNIKYILNYESKLYSMNFIR